MKPNFLGFFRKHSIFSIFAKNRNLGTDNQKVSRHIFYFRTFFFSYQWKVFLKMVWNKKRSSRKIFFDSWSSFHWDAGLLVLACIGHLRHQTRSACSLARQQACHRQDHPSPNSRVPLYNFVQSRTLISMFDDHHSLAAAGCWTKALL